jgi:hypothetical protein
VCARRAAGAAGVPSTGIIGIAPGDAGVGVGNSFELGELVTVIVEVETQQGCLRRLTALSRLAAFGRFMVWEAAKYD